VTPVRQKKLLAIHDENAAGAKRLGIAEAAVIVGNEGSGTKHITSLNLFHLTTIIPVELNAALEQAKHAVSCLAGAEDHLPFGNIKNLALASQGAHCVESVQRMWGKWNSSASSPKDPTRVNG